MAVPTNDFISEYTQWIRQNSSQRVVGKCAEITTPFLDAHNDFIQFYIGTENGETFITDDGYVIADLEMNGVKFTDKRKQMLDSIAFGLDVNIEDGAIVKKVIRDSELPLSMHLLMQAVIKISDMFYLNSSTVRSVFFEDVKNFFTENDVRYTDSVMFRGKSGLTQRFDFVIPASRMQPERFVTTLNNPNKQNVGNALFAWGDIKSTRTESAKNYIIINDNSQQKSKYMEAISNYGATPVLWSNRKSILHELVA